MSEIFNKNCHCCGAQSMCVIGTIGAFEHCKCSSCGYEHFYSKKQVVDALLYENDSDYDADLGIAADFSDLLQWNHKKALRFLRLRYPSADAKILDIGCFNGFFVKKLLECGFDANGIDFNKKALSFGKQEYALEGFISDQTIQDLIAQDKKFDVITLFEVIEHLEYFYDILSKAAKLLQTGGIIILSTPNSKMCWRPDLDFPPHHLSRFTPKALENCIVHLGFRPLKIFEQMSLLDLLRNYVGTFFRYKDKASLRGGEFKNKVLSKILRQFMNKTKIVTGILFSPLDSLLYAFGFRYICQLIIAEKK